MTNWVVFNKTSSFITSWCKFRAQHLNLNTFLPKMYIFCLKTFFQASSFKLLGERALLLNELASHRAFFLIALATHTMFWDALKDLYQPSINSIHYLAFSTLDTLIWGSQSVTTVKEAKKKYIYIQAVHTRIVSVLWWEEGYNVKYSLNPRAEPEGFSKGLGYISQYIPTWATIQTFPFR